MYVYVLVSILSSSSNFHTSLVISAAVLMCVIFVQSSSSKFNRGMLMNIGFAEALKQRTWDCFIFHDVDLLPENDRNLYTCPTLPRHMSVAVDSMAYRSV